MLLAEDNPINLEVSARMLRKLGCQVDVASDGEEAVQAAMRRRYDIIFMDCQMPGMDGFAATRAIRERLPGDRSAPIVALTASALASDREECLEAGMDDFLGKPVRLEAFEAMLLKWLGGQEMVADSKPDSPLLFDPRAIREISQLGRDGEENLLDRFIELFDVETQKRIAALREALDSGRAEAVWPIAHSMKGACRNIGAMAMGEECETLESSAMHGDLAGARESIERIEELFERSLEAMKRERGADF